MKSFRYLAAGGVLVAMLAGASVAAQTETGVRTTQNGIAYVTGGIGTDEADAIRRTASRYNLRLTIVASNGEYLSDVAVEIGNQAGVTVFRTRTLGPFLYAALPPGQYRVTVRDGQVAQTRAVSVQASHGTNVQFNLGVSTGAPSPAQ